MQGNNSTDGNINDLVIQSLIQCFTSIPNAQNPFFERSLSIFDRSANILVAVTLYLTHSVFAFLHWILDVSNKIEIGQYREVVVFIVPNISNDACVQHITKK